MAVNFIRWNSTSKIYELSTNDGASFGALPLDASILNQGIIGSIARIATGTPDGTKFVRDDLTLQSINLSSVWPIGSVFIAVVSTNPGTLLGFGTWTAFATGRTIVGIDAAQVEFDVVEETGGSKTHTLATSEIPAHTHTQDSHNHTQDAHNHTQDAHTHQIGANQTDASGVYSDTVGTRGGVNVVTDSTTATNQAATATNQAATATNQNTGGGGSHNNLQPYIVVYMWKRTA